MAATPLVMLSERLAAEARAKDTANSSATPARPRASGTGEGEAMASTPPSNPISANVHSPATRPPSGSSRPCQPRSSPTSKPAASAAPRPATACKGSERAAIDGMDFQCTDPAGGPQLTSRKRRAGRAPQSA